MSDMIPKQAIDREGSKVPYLSLRKEVAEELQSKAAELGKIIAVLKNVQMNLRGNLFELTHEQLTDKLGVVRLVIDSLVNEY